jgi:hypothetical protein
MHCDWGSACNYLQDAKIPHVMWYLIKSGRKVWGLRQ